MADKFVMTHAEAKKAETRVNDIFAIKQSLGEGLRDFLARYNRVRMPLPNMFEGMAIAAFQNRLSREGSRASRKLLSRLMKYPPTTWDKIHNSYYDEVRADDDDLNRPTRGLILVQTEPKKEQKVNMRRDHPVSRPNKERHQPYVRTSAPSFRYKDALSRPRSGTHRNDSCMPPLLFAHNLCVSPTEVVYAFEKLGTNVKWPPKMRSNPNTRKSDTLCEFHQERGQKIEDCIALRLEVENLLQQGHLKELLNDKGRNTLARGRER
uniref:Retrotransposon gag domain-containing protein n=1 Tax=Nicotiana tabacum TaxID=4097 RepID=A0A1S3ZZK6_TOBAC|nr:PREDICTED: uncharacterized protein LOC107792134 [Nicotiana tabacum]